MHFFREGESECRGWVFDVFGLMLCEWFVGVWVYIYIYVLYICHTFNIRVATCDVEGSPI